MKVFKTGHIHGYVTKQTLYHTIISCIYFWVCHLINLSSEMEDIMVYGYLMKSCNVFLTPKNFSREKNLSYQNNTIPILCPLLKLMLHLHQINNQNLIVFFQLIFCRLIHAERPEETITFFDEYLSTLTRSVHFPAKKLSQLPGQLDASQ